jgi:hypothetical protein
MMKRYYTSRNKPHKLTVQELYRKLLNAYILLRNKDYFKGKAGITKNNLPEEITLKAELALGFQAFPISKWRDNNIVVTEDHIFDVIELLCDYVSKPGEWTEMTTDTGWNYTDYDGYDDAAGQTEYLELVNSFLCDYGSGYELTGEGTILSIGSSGLQYILDADIIPYDEANVDGKVRKAILKWRNRHLDMGERRQAIRELADVFEWLKKTKKLEKVLNRKDEAAIFEIANSFAIRHHEPKQKKEYDETIWYSWIFHFYLATYHAVIRMLKK